MNTTIYSGFVGALFSLFFIQCESSRYEISKREIGEMKQTYSAETINYFYETAFFEDYVGAKDFLIKWENDILIGLEGEMWLNDSLYVSNLMDQVNELNLPIKMRFAEDKSKANLSVYFGAIRYLREALEIPNDRTFLGIGGINGSPSSGLSAKVGIANDAVSYHNLTGEDSLTTRKGIIAEEIAQCLGITGDSWANYLSLFFEGKSKISDLQKFDKELLKFLYEPAIPSNLSRLDFERYFQDVLYHINAKDKLIDYVKENEIPVEHLEYISDNGLIDSTLLKYPRLVHVKLAGDYQAADSVFCSRAVALFNTVSNQLQLALAPNDIWHETPSITIEYKHIPSHPSATAERFFQAGEMMFARRVQGTIKLSFDSSRLSQENKNKLVLHAIYKILGLDAGNDDIATNYIGDKLAFKPDYKERLALFYNPILPSGFSHAGLDEVIRTLN